MHGCVWEWCQDTWSNDLGSEAVTDPKKEEGIERVVRGDAWDYMGRNVRSASRYHYPPDHRQSTIGFRLSLG